MTYRLRNLVLAVALASLAAVLITFYVSNYKKNVQHAENNVTVFVAQRDIPAGTSGANAAARLKPVEIARRNVVPGAISTADQVKTLVATDAIYAGEQVSARRFRPVKEGGIRAELKGNVRAIQISGDPHQLLAGTLKRGDRVDVVGNFKVQEEEGDEEKDRAYTRTVLRDLLVLTAPAADPTGSRLTSPAGTVVSAQLALTDAQAQKLFFTTKNGEWHLDLRSVTDASDSPESIESIDSILCDGMRRNNPVCFRRGGR